MVVQADRRIALFGSTMYVVMPKRHARPSSTIVPLREEDSASLAKREYASSVSAWRLQLFPAVLSLSLSHLLTHFFPILFFPIHELWLTVERFWSARAFYGTAAPFITAGCSRIHIPIIKAEQDLMERVVPYLF